MKTDSEAIDITRVIPSGQHATSVLTHFVVTTYNPAILQEPHVYRMTEVCAHDGVALLDIIHEPFGDGTMSAIDFKITIEKIKSAQGKDRVLMTWNGKFLPHIEQTM